MSQANTPVPVPDSPVLERPAASQTATTAPPPVNVTPPQASSAAPQTDTTAPRSSAATTPVVFPDGTLTAPNPSQSLTPTPVPQVSVIPASSNGTASIPHQEHWRVELCDADDMETCCAAWCVPCCLSGRIASRLDNFPKEDPEYDECNSTCCVSFGLYCCYMGCVPAYMDRNAVRRAFDIKGNDCLDCLSAFFCTPCTLTQADFELKRRAAEARAMSPRQYQSGAPQMAYMPPLQQQQRVVRYPQMQPMNPAYLQVPAGQPRMQPQSQPTAQQAPYVAPYSAPYLPPTLVSGPTFC